MSRLVSVLGIQSVIEVLPIVLFAMFVYWLFRRKRQKKKFGQEFKIIRKQSRLNEIGQLLFLGWSVAVVCMTLTPTLFWSSLSDAIVDAILSKPFYIKPVKFEKWNLVSVWWLHFVKYHCRYLYGVSLRGEIINMVENIFFFIPLGTGLPLLCEKISFFKVILSGFLCTVFIEFTQAFIGRDGTIDDVIYNTLGAIVGYLLFLLLKAIFPKFTEKCKISANDLWIKKQSALE